MTHSLIHAHIEKSKSELIGYKAKCTLVSRKLTKEMSTMLTAQGGMENARRDVTAYASSIRGSKKLREKIKRKGH